MKREALKLVPRHGRCADLAVIGACVQTLNRIAPHATGVAVKDGVIVAVGGDDEIRYHCDATTEFLDGAGLTIVPGLVDAHHHPMWVTKFVAGVDASAIRDPAVLQGALRAQRRNVGEAGVVRAWGLDYALFARTGLDGRELERLAGGPALVTLMDCHTYLATPTVLQRAGITGRVTFRDRSEVVMQGDEPTGELREFEAFERVSRALPTPSTAEVLGEVRETLAKLATLGLTGLHVMDGEPATYDLLDLLESQGDLPLRLVVPLWIKPFTSDNEIDYLIKLQAARGRRWRGGVAKFFLDGVVETGTAWLEEPDAHGRGEVSGWPDPSRYARVVRRFAAAGFQCVTHAIGDRAIRETLDAYRDGPSLPGIRHRIEHLETLTDRELDRLVSQRVVASMQPLHMQWRASDGSDEWSRRLGEQRAARAFRVADVLRAGGTVALGSDWPVADRDPRIGMAWARLRRPPGEPDAHVFEPPQRLSPRQALQGYTSGAAAAAGDEHQLGSISPGRHADLTAFAGDPLQVSGDDIVDLPVAFTTVAGRITHRADVHSGAQTRRSCSVRNH
jgi:predicted amidohydrolase YtcJ